MTTTFIGCVSLYKNNSALLVVTDVFESVDFYRKTAQNYIDFL
jgi:hypothetical protein